MHHSTDSIAHTTAFGTPAVEHWLPEPSRWEFTTQRVCTMFRNYISSETLDTESLPIRPFSRRWQPFPHDNGFLNIGITNQDDVLRATLSLTILYDETHRHVLVRSEGTRCSSVVRAFGHGAMGRRMDPSWGEPIELFLDPASAPRLV